jgi:hypothetical protein
MTAHHTLLAGSDKPAGQAVTLIDRSGCPASSHLARDVRKGCICPDAKEARRVQHAAYKPGYVGATGTRRRLQAMSVMAFSDTDIAEHCPLTVAELAKLRRTQHVTRTDHDTVAAVYRKLCLQPLAEGRFFLGPSQEERDAALAKGWAGPLHWNNIDDGRENGRAAVSAKPARQRRVPIDRLTTEVARLTAAKKTAAEIARDLKVAERTVVRLRRRFRETQAAEQDQASNEAA